MTEPLEIIEGGGDGTRQLIMRGELDVATAHAVADRLTELLGQYGRIGLDLSGLSFIDSTGLGVLVRAAELAERQGGDLTIHAVSPSVLRVVTLTGLAERLHLTVRQD